MWKIQLLNIVESINESKKLMLIVWLNWLQFCSRPEICEIDVSTVALLRIQVFWDVMLGC
jgi:hypothetical protein